MSALSLFLSGAVAMTFVACGIYFLRFWRSTKDRFFGIFGLAFLVMALEHVVILWVGGGRPNGANPLFYLFRLAAFAMILAAIIDKNRQNEHL